MRRSDHEYIVHTLENEVKRLQRANDDLLDRLALASAKPLPYASLPEFSDNGDEDPTGITDPEQLFS